MKNAGKEMGIPASRDSSLQPGQLVKLVPGIDRSRIAAGLEPAGMPAILTTPDGRVKALPSGTLALVVAAEAFRLVGRGLTVAALGWVGVVQASDVAALE